MIAMSPYVVKKSESALHILGLTCLNLRQTLDCGQAFRFSENPDGSWQGIVQGRLLHLGMRDGTLILYDTDEETFDTLWRNYLDLDRDYAQIADVLCAHPALEAAVRFSSGIRVLRQEPWEALCSFIISQNNHLARIKGIVARLCETFGEPVSGGFAFPSAQSLADKTPDDLAVLRAGFRAKYICDAAQKVALGEIDFAYLRHAPFEDAMQMLMRIRGVGPKVAECALLYGCGRMESFPKDVWIKRAVEKLFDGTLPACALPYAGIAQQYLFYYARETKLAL